jgi:hypothetical protein
MAAIALAPVIYLSWTYYERAQAISGFVRSVCADRAIAVQDMFAGLGAQRDCLDRYAYTPYILALQSRQQIVSELIAICEKTPGAISKADRFAEKVAELGGATPKSDRSICLEKIGPPFYP